MNLAHNLTFNFACYDYFIQILYHYWRKRIFPTVAFFSRMHNFARQMGYSIKWDVRLIAWWMMGIFDKRCTCRKWRVTLTVPPRHSIRSNRLLSGWGNFAYLSFVDWTWTGCMCSWFGRWEVFYGPVFHYFVPNELNIFRFVNIIGGYFSKSFAHEVVSFHLGLFASRLKHIQFSFSFVHIS